MEAITIELPLPPQYRAKSRIGKHGKPVKGRLIRPLSPNSRCHWRVVAKAKKAYKASVDARLLQAIGEGRAKRYGWTRATAQYDYYHENKSMLDNDNIIGSMKYALDSFKRVGILTDDHDVIPLPPRRYVDPGNPRVIVTITPLQEPSK